MSGDLSERLVDSLNATYGVHPGQRAAHAKGMLCAASFTPTTEAAQLSSAQHLAAPVRAHVRFSNGSGDPTAPDTQRDARGIAVKFYLSGATTDLVAISLPAFFARTPEDLLAFNEARRPDPTTGQPDLNKVGEYLGAHPEAMTAVNAAITQPIPASFATLTYNSLHAFGFETSAGNVRYGRYHLVPDAGEHFLTDDETGQKPHDYLGGELKERLGVAPVGFRVNIEIASDDDPVNDCTAIWPDGRETIDVGRLEINGLANDREHDGDILVFDPTRVTDGIVLSDDPILLARSGAYGVSVARRTA